MLCVYLPELAFQRKMRDSLKTVTLILNRLKICGMLVERIAFFQLISQCLSFLQIVSFLVLAISPLPISPRAFARH